MCAMCVCVKVGAPSLNITELCEKSSRGRVRAQSSTAPGLDDGVITGECWTLYLIEFKSSQ